MLSANNDYEEGRKAFSYFFNASVPFTGLTAGEYAKQIAGSENGVQFFYEGLGLAINTIKADGFLSGNSVQASMQNLALKAQGRIPAKSSFYAAISGKAQDFSFLEAAPTVIKDTAAAALQGAQEVGIAVLDTGKSLLTIGPIVIVAAVLFIVWSKTKKLA